ncbi:MAG: metallophosphoesterase [Spirochaetaceae bacterium]|jgi:Icc-related predicted phosphoesterase|nr:metallophosphoesterase [Spirochaetaceae bacterium]
MKILCVADMIDPLVYSDQIKTRYADVGLALSAGDLPMDYLEFIVSSLNVPLHFVFGNHNLDEYDYYISGRAGSSNDMMERQRGEHNFSSGLIHAGNHLRREGQLLIMGLGGSMRYNKSENQYTEFQMYWRIIKLLPHLFWNKLIHKRYVDILLTHAAPAGIGDLSDPCHKGFKAFLWFMEKFKPKYLLHGHIHLYDMSAPRVHKYCETTIINVYSHYIVDTDTTITVNIEENKNNV